MKDYKSKADTVRALSLISTTEAASGHPTSCLSAADIATVLFDSYFSYDLQNPKHPNNDRFILSKGHAAPLLYSIFALAGGLSREELLTLRKFESNLEGHPTPRWKYAEVGTGSLGQGVSVAAGIALLAKREGLTHKTFVLTGDGELAEGQIYEACNFASYYNLDNLVITADINAIAQTGPTMFDHDMEKYKGIFSSLGCSVEIIDGHNYEEIEKAFQNAIGNQTGKPYVVLAKTIKGKGISFLEGRTDYHGKAVKKEELSKALTELSQSLDIVKETSIVFTFSQPIMPRTMKKSSPSVAPASLEYKEGNEAATREVFGDILVEQGHIKNDLYVFDGDVGNSTFTEKFEKVIPDRFVQCYIAEQNMVSVGAGFSSLGKVPVIATFGAFLTRAYDQIRMANISRLTMKFVGSHAGVSIGEDGPSQMALEDIAMFASFPDSLILQPSDAISTKKLLPHFLEYKGLSYLRTLRPKTKVIYNESDEFVIGGSKLLRHTEEDSLVLIGTGITVHEILKAYDLLVLANIKVSVIDAYSLKPLDKNLIRQTVQKTKEKMIATVEDHYITGGLGDLVSSELSGDRIRVVKRGVGGIPFSGDKDNLLKEYGLDAQSIVSTVKELLNVK